jgi:hypothetical protein
MTDVEKLLHDRLLQLPGFQLAVSRLQLEPVISQAELASRKVSNHVEQLLREIHHSPVVQRKIITESSTPRIFWSSMELKQWISDNQFTL